MYELFIILALLLPVSWWAGYRSGKERGNGGASKADSSFSKSYFVGLNYLLNEEPDKAIDTFIGMLEIDPEMVETHLALANLFRRRGEVDRAIRIHQNLIARPLLTSSQRKMSLMELGYDYTAAGLLDRAENIFRELAVDREHKAESLKQLLLIYQQTKDWQNAIRVSELLQASTCNNVKIQIAHFYCELAENCLSERTPKEALSYAKKALLVDTSCARATLLCGDIEYALAHFERAIKVYKGLIKQDVALLPEAIVNIADSFNQLCNKKGLMHFYQMAIDNGAGISCILSYAKEIQLAHGDQNAAEYIVSQMVEHPSIKGLLKLIELHLKHASDSARPSLAMLHRVVAKLVENKPVYHCYQCGFDSKTMFWQCPGCKNWGSVKPIQGIEGE